MRNNPQVSRFDLSTGVWAGFSGRRPVSWDILGAHAHADNRSREITCTAIFASEANIRTIRTVAKLVAVKEEVGSLPNDVS